MNKYLILIALTLGCAPQKGNPGPAGVGYAGPQGSKGYNSLLSIVNNAPSCNSSGGQTILVGLDSNRNNILDSSEVSQSAQVCNGAQGSAGPSGADGGTVSFDLVQPIMPCGAVSSPYKEVILGLAGGQLLSSFSETPGGSNTRFSFIPNGTYTDTDSSGCQFVVSGDGSTESHIHWNAQGSYIAGGYDWTPDLGWKAQ